MSVAPAWATISSSVFILWALWLLGWAVWAIIVEIYRTHGNPTGLRPGDDSPDEFLNEISRQMCERRACAAGCQSQICAASVGGEKPMGGKRNARGFNTVRDS